MKPVLTYGRDDRDRVQKRPRQRPLFRALGVVTLEVFRGYDLRLELLQRLVHQLGPVQFV